ncbi:hypothetical protein PVAG01_07403 [Phlyctema vagabunda]|uniref:Uncharacterized protein n=1 Tax=Phlyctema vagabunda TaxID=108571 RepID=A0ABR4PCB8_9HELO
MHLATLISTTMMVILLVLTMRIPSVLGLAAMPEPSTCFAARLAALHEHSTMLKLRVAKLEGLLVNTAPGELLVDDVLVELAEIEGIQWDMDRDLRGLNRWLDWAEDAAAKVGNEEL